MTGQVLLEVSLSKVEIRDRACGRVFYIGPYETPEQRELVAEYWRVHKHGDCPANTGGIGNGQAD